MKLFWKGTASVLFYVITAALLVYAASRSFDFIKATMPKDQQIIGFLGLAATSGGMVTWLMLFLYKGEGLGQKVTAGLMTTIDMLGEFGLFTMDTLYQSGKSGVIKALTADEIRLVVLALSGLIAINILATVCFHLFDPENLRRMRESFVRDQLEASALKEIEKRGDELARTMAPLLAQQWANQFESQFSDLRALGLGSLKQPKPEAITQSAQVKPKPDAVNKPQPAQITPIVEDLEEVQLEAIPLSLRKNGNGYHPNA